MWFGWDPNFYFSGHDCDDYCNSKINVGENEL